MVYNVEKLGTINIGRHGENLARVIEIDVSSMLKQWPDATITLLVKRNKDEAPYVAVTELVDGILCWPVTRAETAVPGNGLIEIRATRGETIAKSVTGFIRVSAALTGNETDPPEQAKSWVDQVIEYGNKATEAAIKTKQEADRLSGINAKAVTLPEGSEATVTVEEGCLVYGIPRGDTGDVGPQGPQGPQGPKGEQGIPGADGKDAVVDATLTQSGQAADAKTTGDAVSQLKDDIDELDSRFQRDYTYNLYDFNDESKVISKYIYDIYKDGKHQTAVASAENYSYSKVKNLSDGEYVFSCWGGLGSDKACVFAFDKNDNYIGKITGEVKNSIYSTNVYISITLPENTAWVYVNNSTIDGDIYHYVGTKYMFLKGNIFPNEFIPYKVVYNLSDNVELPKLYEIEKTVISNTSRIDMIECASERESFFDVVKRLPYSANEYIKLHDGSEQYNDNQYVSYGAIDGQNVATVELPSSTSTDLVRNFPAKTCYKNFVYSVYIENVENVKEISVKAVTLGTGGGNYTISRNANLLKNGWNHINKTGYVVNTPNSENISRIEVKIISTSNGPIKVSIGDIHSYSRKAMCTIWFDDQHSTVYSKAFPLMKSRNIEGTMSVIAGSVNNVSGNFMTKTQLIELWSNGWDLCNHTWYTDSLTNYSIDQATYSIARGKEWLKNIGVGNSSNYLVLPQGDINAEIEESAKKYATMIRYAGAVKQSIKYCMMPHDDWYHVPCYSIKNTTSVEDVKSLIDEAVEVGSWITLLYHGFVDGTANVQTLWNIGDFETILDYLLTKDIDIVTASDAVMKQ